jgi:hypothetical protein
MGETSNLADNGPFSGEVQSSFQNSEPQRKVLSVRQLRAASGIHAKFAQGTGWHGLCPMVIFVVASQFAETSHVTLVGIVPLDFGLHARRCRWIGCRLGPWPDGEHA